jgi:hypothetical protein
MQRRSAMRWFIPGIVLLSLVSSSVSMAQESARQLNGPSRIAVFDDSQSSPSQDSEMLKKDLRSQKKQIVAANMDLTDGEAEKFWPVYDRYAAEQAKIYDVKLALIEQYLDNYNTMSGDDAENYIRRRAGMEQEVMALRIKFVPEFRKVLSGRQTALFYQIEWRLDLMINLQLAQAPLINP